MKTTEFTETELETPLCELPDAEFEMGGRFDAIAREAGDSSGRSAANNLGIWSVKLRKAIEIVTTPQEEE